MRIGLSRRVASRNLLSSLFCYPKLLGTKGVERNLSYPATEGKVPASTQRQALNALVFLYRDVLDQPLDWELAPVRSKRHC